MPCCALAGDVPSMWIEVGPTEMHYTPDKISGEAGMYHVTTPADHGLEATGGRIRVMAHIADGWYAGVEGDFAYFDGASLNGDYLARSGATMTTTLAMRGDIQQGKFVAGKRFVWDRWMVASELAPGLQISEYTSTDIPNYVEPWTQSWYVVEVHALGGAWLTDRISLTAEASADLTHPDRVQLAVLVGGHFHRTGRFHRR